MYRTLRLTAALSLAFQAVRLGRDEVNIRTLARHLGCSLADARRLYHLSRRDGYGSAYQAVFGASAPTAAAQPLDEPAAKSEASASEALSAPSA